MKTLIVLFITAGIATACGNGNQEGVQSDSLPKQDQLTPADSLKQGDTINRNKLMQDTIASKRIPMN